MFDGVVSGGRGGLLSGSRVGKGSLVCVPMGEGGSFGWSKWGGRCLMSGSRGLEGVSSVVLGGTGGSYEWS